MKCGISRVFSIYINELIHIPRRKGIRCHIINVFIACILFADDMTLMAPTRDAMQQLLDTCGEYCSDFCLKFNAGKTKVMLFGKASVSYATMACIHFQGKPINFVTSCKYLGFYIVAGRVFKCSVQEDLCGFFGAVNSILSSTRRPKENVQLQLLYSNCVPRLTYGAAVKDLSASEKQQLNVAVNNAVRRIFSFRRWESIRFLREFYRFDSIEAKFAKAKMRFEKNLAIHSNCTLRFLSTLPPLE